MREIPLFNPVFHLGLGLAQIDLDRLEALIAELKRGPLESHAGRLRALVSPITEDDNRDALDHCLDSADGGGRGDGRSAFRLMKFGSG